MLATRAVFACALLALALACTVATSAAPPIPRPNVLVLGVVHDDPATMRRRMAPMADYMARQLADVGIEDVLVVVAADRHGLTDLLRVGRVDWISETAFNAIVVEKSGYAQIVARTWRNGSPNYRSLFFVRKDSPIEGLSDMSGVNIAFEREASASAFFIPALTLINQEQTLCRLGHPLDRASDDCLGFVFSKRPFNTAAWVHKDITQVGVFSSDDWDSSEAMPEVLKKDMRIVHETPSFPRGVELLRSDLDALVRERLVATMLQMHSDPAARQALANYFGTRKFDALSEQDLTTIAAFGEAMSSFEQQVGALR